MRLRRLIRALHRDAGYFVIGFTLIYALSGLAVNHLQDWDPNFTQVKREFQLEPKLLQSAYQKGGTPALLAALPPDLEVKGELIDSYELSESELELSFAETTLFIQLKQGKVIQEGQRPRPLLRVINWLHLNRGKAAWSYLADTYAVILLYLAISGYFMLPNKSLRPGRRELLVSAGLLVPILYVVFSGGP